MKTGVFSGVVNMAQLCCCIDGISAMEMYIVLTGKLKQDKAGKQALLLKNNSTFVRQEKQKLDFLILRSHSRKELKSNNRI